MSTPIAEHYHSVEDRDERNLADGSTGNPKFDSDRLCLLQATSGEKAAADEIVARLGPVVRRVTYRLTGWSQHVDDIVQEVFLALHLSGKRYRGDSSLETWVIGITIHTCRKWFCQQQKNKALPFNEDECVSIRTATVSRNQVEIQDEIYAILNQLSHEDRELVVLRYLEEYDLDQLSDLLNIRKNTLEVKLHRIRKQLKQKLGVS